MMRRRTLITMRYIETFVASASQMAFPLRNITLALVLCLAPIFQADLLPVAGQGPHVVIHSTDAQGIQSLQQATALVTDGDELPLPSRNPLVPGFFVLAGFLALTIRMLGKPAPHVPARMHADGRQHGRGPPLAVFS